MLLYHEFSHVDGGSWNIGKKDGLFFFMPKDLTKTQPKYEQEQDVVNA